MITEYTHPIYGPVTTAHGTIDAGDILHVTDNDGRPTLMLVSSSGPCTKWDSDGIMRTFQGVTGPLFDTWIMVNTPDGKVYVPSIQVGPSGWVSRDVNSDVTGKLAWDDNPLNPVWGQ